VKPLVEAAGAAFHYPGRGRAVGPFSLSVHAGELHHIRGPSGCGKSTFARMLAGLIPHLYRGELFGEVRAGARRTVDAPLWQLTARVGMVGQNPAAQLLAATVRDEIIFGLENLGLSRAAMQARLDAALDTFGLRTLENRDPQTLSGGEQQKLVLAAITARHPQVMVLDEALSMLDTASARDVAEHVERLRRDGIGVVAFEHRPPVESWRAAARCHALMSEPLVESTLPVPPQPITPFHLNVRGLGVTLGGRRVLHDVDLSLAGGQVIALIGVNGAGKTTLLRALAGLQPHSGSICDDAGGAARLGLCFQNPDRQIFNATVRQEILFGNTGVDEGLYRYAVELLGLMPYEDTPPLLLSEGEKKRLTLAILLTRPGLRGLCLDEPTLGQDDNYRRGIGRIVRHLASAGYLCVVATHDLQWAAEWCDQFIALHQGRIASQQRVGAARRVAAEERQCHAAV
jgi:energy-coupling factor transporter ATP-binding protein EcfA2